MAIFVIYSNLDDLDDRDVSLQWKETLGHLLSYKHQIYIIGDNQTELQKNLSAILGKDSPVVCCEKDKNRRDQLLSIKKLSAKKDEKMIFAIEDLAEQKDIKNIPDAFGVELKHKVLCALSKRYQYFNSSEFNELHEIQTKLKVQEESTHWQITPLSNIKNQLGFITAVRLYANANPGSSMSACLLAVKEFYSEKTLLDLDSVIYAPANVPLLGHGIFAKLLTNETEIGALLRKTQKTAEENAEKQAVQDRDTLSNSSLGYQQI